MLPERFQVKGYNSQTEGDPNRLFLHISVSENFSSPYGQFSARLCYIRWDEEGEGENTQTVAKIQYHSDYTHTNEAHFHWFQITAQYNRHPDKDGLREREPYVVRVGYREEEVTLAKLECVEKKIKFLKWLNNRIEKYEEKYGRLNDNLGRTLNVVFAELGIEALVITHPDDQNKSFGKRVETVWPESIEEWVNKVIKRGSVYPTKEGSMLP